MMMMMMMTTTTGCSDATQDSGVITSKSMVVFKPRLHLIHVARMHTSQSLMLLSILRADKTIRVVNLHHGSSNHVVLYVPASTDCLTQYVPARGLQRHHVVVTHLFDTEDSGVLCTTEYT